MAHHGGWHCATQQRQVPKPEILNLEIPNPNAHFPCAEHSMNPTYEILQISNAWPSHLAGRAAWLGTLMGGTVALGEGA